MRTLEQDRERKRRERLKGPAVKEREAAWRRANHAKHMLKNARSNAKAKNVPFSLTIEDVSIPETCPVLGIPIGIIQNGTRGPKDHSASLDRLIPELGYVPGNVTVISHRANRIKNDASLVELEKVTAWVRSQSAER